MYIFICPTCGEYPVEEETIKTFCLALEKGRLVWNTLSQAVSEGAVGTVEFKEVCPQCSPREGISKAEIKARWPTKDQQT